MSTTTYVKHSSAYVPSAPYVRDSGSWKQVTEIFGKAGGVWSSVYTPTGNIDRRFIVNPGFNDTVYSTALQSDGKMLAGGDFTNFNGTTVTRFARLNSDETLDTAFMANMGTGFDDSVYSIDLQSDGKILVGGRSTTFNGTTANRFARINSDGTLDTTFATNIGTGFSSVVYSIVLQPDGKILVGGAFGSFNGTTVTRFARLNSDGTLDTTFATNTGTGFSSIVRDIVLQPDGKILVSGDFTTFNGTAVSKFVRLNSDGTLDTTFTTNMGTGFNSSVWTTSLQSDGKILVGGYFSTLNGTTVNRLVRLNSDGTLDTAFTTNMGAGFNSAVLSTALQSDGKILAVGQFSTFNGTTAGRLVRLNSDGTLDTAFMANIGAGFFTGTVRTTSLQSDGKILVGGDSKIFNGGISNTLVKLNSDGTVDSYFTPGPYTTPFLAPAGISSFAIQPDGKVVAVGSCFPAGSPGETKIVRLNSDETVDTAFMANIGTGFLNQVFVMALQSDGKILVGGDFTYFNGAPTNRLVRLNSDGTLDTAFMANMGTGFSGAVRAIFPQSDGKILVGHAGGAFNGSFLGTLIRLNSDGTLDTAFTNNMGSGPNDDVWTISLQSDGKILVGGQFTSLNGVGNKNRLARINSDGTEDTTFATNLGTGFNSTVREIALQSDGKILVGGLFQTFNGTPVKQLVRLNSDGTLDTAFMDNIGTSFSGTLYVGTIVLQSDGKIIVAGESIDYNGKPVGTFVRLNSDGTQDPFFLPRAAPTAEILSCKVVDGGNYLMVGSSIYGDNFGLGPNYNGFVYFNL